MFSFFTGGGSGGDTSGSQNPSHRHRPVSAAIPDTPGTDDPSSTLSPGSGNNPPPSQSFINLRSLAPLSNSRIILASGSPRRSEILSTLLPRFDVVVPVEPEDRPGRTETPMEYVVRLARAKCMEVYTRELDVRDDAGRDLGLVVAADTVVCSWSGEIMGKPLSRRHNVEMLKSLRDGPTGGIGPDSARTTTTSAIPGLEGGDRDAAIMARLRGESSGVWCRVYTGVAVMKPLDSARDPGYALECVVDETGVVFDPNMPDDVIEAYVGTGHGDDKAGGFGIQGLGSILIDRIEGSADNVVGLPLRQTLKLIETVMTIEELDEEELEAANADVYAM